MRRPLLLAAFLVALHGINADPGTAYSEGGGRETGDEQVPDSWDADRDAYFKERAIEILEELQRHPPVLSQGEIPTVAKHEEQQVEIELNAPVKGEPEETAPIVEIPEKPAARPEKKGQNEFVEFVDPRDSHQLKNGQTLDKRVVTESSSTGKHNHALDTGNMLFLAVVTVCVVASVVGVVGGGIYWHGLMKQRAAAEAAEYPHYAPTGPVARVGKTKQRGSPIGDKAMAYNAQLHHYQQTKQKIISGDGGNISPHRAEPDDSGSESDENNFSVYECPGLAPTGDIEVQNPNFESER